MKNVCLLLFIAGYLFLCFAASDIQQVRIKMPERLTLTHTVLYFKPLHVIFEGFDVKSLSCTIRNETSDNWFTFTLVTLVNYNNGTAVFQTSGFEANWKMRFLCEVKSRNDVNTYVKFHINTVNRILSAVYGKRLQFELKDTPEYEGITEYVCNEGEIVDLTCSKCLNYGRLKLRYYDQNGTKMVETDEVSFVDPLNFRLLVRAENDRSYVDCTHITDEDNEGHDRREFTYRVIFIIRDKSPKNDVFIITINGVELISSGYESLHEEGLNEVIYTYHYKFIYSDTLNITCENNDKSKVSDIETSLSPSPLVANAFKTAESIGFKQKGSLYNQNGIWYFLETRNLHEAILQFKVNDFNEKKYYNANITFYIDHLDGPAILGLSRSNIIYQYSKSATEWFIHYQYVVGEVLKLTCLSKQHHFVEWKYGENSVISDILQNNYYSYTSWNFYIHTKTNGTITCKSRGRQVRTRTITIVLHIKPELPTLENKNDLKINSETDSPKIIPERQFKALGIVGIVVGSLLAVMGTYCCWRLRKRTQVTQEKQLSRSAGEDYNQVNKVTDQTESPEYECIEYNDNTHPDALNANQESSTPIRAPAPPPRSALPSKNTRFQISPRGCTRHREMKQCGCSTNQKSGQECTQIENKYDYAYEVKKKCSCVAPLNRGARKPLLRNHRAGVMHRVPPSPPHQ